jgi:short subunit dehydrogenase
MSAFRACPSDCDVQAFRPSPECLQDPGESGRTLADCLGRRLLSATFGIGLETSVRLAAMGAEVVLVGRDRERGEAAVGTVKGVRDRIAASLMLCAFASLIQIRALAAAVIVSRPKLHILTNNACVGGASGER